MLLAAGGGGTLTSCSGSIPGSGHVVTEERDVQAFNEVLLADAGRITIVKGDKESLTVKAEDNILPEILTSVKQNRLTIRFKKWDGDTLRIRPTKPVTFIVTVRELRDIKLINEAQVSN
jgi:hypothetical protein